MIDIENRVFDHVSKALKAEYSGITVSGEYAESFAKFPAVTLVEADNRPVPSWRTCENMENAVTVMYEVNIFSNRTSGKKEEAKRIADTADAALAALGFMRIYRQQRANLNDATIYRIVCRYRGTAIPNDDGRTYIYSAIQ